jgi:uncharacterized RDD family membrane protein YckC
MTDQWTVPPDAYPDAAAAQGELAGFWRRLGALLVDLILIGISSGIISFIITVPGGMDVTARNNVSALVQVVVAVVYLGYLWSSRGESVGYMAFGIRVVKSNGTPLTLGAAAVRALALVASLYLCLVPALISALMVAFGGRQQAIHDLLTGTRVIRD